MIAVWDDLKAAEKPHRTSVLDGIPRAMPALALASKLLGRATKVGVSVPDAWPAAVPVDATRGRASARSEEDLGSVLLAIVSEAKANGLDAERALRTALRTLQDDIRMAEDAPAADDAPEAEQAQ